MVINALQAFALITVVAVMASYNPKGARYRVGVSAVSGLIMGSCASLALAYGYGRLEANWFTAALALAFLARVIYCRGDSAQLLRMRR